MSDYKDIEFRVTAEHISLGKRSNSKSCAVVLAIVSHLNSSFSVETDGRDIFFYVSDGLLAWACRTPASVALFIEAFDDRVDIYPFTFTLPLPTEILRQPISEGAE